MTSTESVVHRQTSTSTVKCGAPMRDAKHPDGWDLGDVVVDSSYTCIGCISQGRGK